MMAVVSQDRPRQEQVMKRRSLLALAVTATLLAVVALAVQQRSGLLLLEWAHKAPAETPPTAVLIEMGLKDLKATDWSSKATVAGARVVHREGYRFRTGDKLVEPGGWEASSHRGLRVPPKNPAVSKMEPIATVGVVLHLADVKDDAALTIEPKEAGREKQTVALKDVLAGKAHKLWDGAATVRLISTATLVTVGSKNEDDYPAATYGPDGTLWVAYVSYTVRDDSRRIEQKPYQKQPENFKALYTPEFADQVWVKSYRGGKWSEPTAVTGPHESIARCAIGVDSTVGVLVAYSAFRNGRQAVYTRHVRQARVGAKAELVLGQESVENDRGSGLSPVMCIDRTGFVHVNYQYIEEGAKPGTPWVWGHVRATGPNGEDALAYDVYDGDYDVKVLLTHAKGNKLAPTPIATSSRFEARPSIAYDPKGRLWIAYEEGPEQWGKDYGSLAPNRGNPLYSARSVRVVCIDADGKLKRPVAELPTSTVEPPGMAGDALRTNQFEKASRWAYPKIGIDGKGRVWLTYRRNFGSRYSSHPGAYWITFARRLDGDRWSDEIELHHSDGLLDSRPVVLPHNSGGLIVVHNTDGRYTTPEVINNDIYLSYLNLPGDPVEPKLVPHDPGKKNPKLVARAKAEAEAVKRIRSYRVESGGKKYMLLRGEYHRHTEISWDGSPDGSLEDMFRYAIDAAAMDWIGCGDHDNGAGREYPWWLTQKFNDAYHVPGAFTPMFTYERSVAYPHGHRNCMFAQRGVRTLPRLAAEKGQKGVGGVHADDTKMLYRYLHELKGITAVHTSATGMGTDWRDNDPVVEPIVEIYQGDRMSYEHEGAPRAGYDKDSGKEPINVAGWYPKGFINLALEKGYKLGFQASSDHWSTHISFFVILAEKNDRQSLLEAVKKRHCYGATDNIVVDLRSGANVQGDELKTREAPALQMTVLGTADLDKIDVMKDSKVVHTIRPKGREYRGAWTEPNPAQGTHYYYIRVLQADGEIAWASPLWIDYRP
jgi:hypothetical protein